MYPTSCDGGKADVPGRGSRRDASIAPCTRGVVYQYRIRVGWCYIETQQRSLVFFCLESPSDLVQSGSAALASFALRSPV
jgi:hypothetical protein